MPDPSQQDALWSASHVAAPYRLKRIVSRNATHYGLFKMPVAGPLGTPSRVVQAYAPHSWRVVEFDLERNGFQPEIPWPATNDNEKLVYEEVVVHEPDLIGQGQSRMYKVQGIYIFARVDKRDHQDVLIMPQSPDAKPEAINGIGPSSYKSGVI